jgi:hypothetical protein
MPYAEYALVHSADGILSVELKRVALERAALRQATQGWSNSPPALQADLLLQYA